MNLLEGPSSFFPGLPGDSGSILNHYFDAVVKTLKNLTTNGHCSGYLRDLACCDGAI